jgi:predicted metal-dependent phosphoesterase TrpH
MTPTELIRHAKKLGLQGLSITDHDTIDSYPEAIETAQKEGIHLGTGVEFSCEFQGASLHILGYDFDPFNVNILQLCKRHHRRREHRNLAMLEKLNQNQMPISYEELLAKARGKTIGRPHIAEIMIDKGYVKTIRDAFNLYIGEHGKCYVQGEPFSVQEAIDILHEAHGKAFVAHPQLLPKQLSLDALLKHPFDGIECFYSRLAKKPWIAIAEQKKWLMSGGSDFHGSVKPEVVLGCNGVDRETFYRIFEHPVA